MAEHCLEEQPGEEDVNPEVLSSGYTAFLLRRSKIHSTVWQMSNLWLSCYYNYALENVIHWSVINIQCCLGWYISCIVHRIDGNCKRVHLKPIFVTLCFLFDKAQKNITKINTEITILEKAQKIQWQPTHRIFASKGSLGNCIVTTTKCWSWLNHWSWAWKLCNYKFYMNSSFIP